MMEIEKIIGPAPDWTRQTWAQRFDDAASALFLHGFIPASVRAQITRKLEQQFKEGIASGRIVERQEQGK